MMDDLYNLKKPAPAPGLPTTYQDTAGLPDMEQGGLKGDALSPYSGMWQLDQMMQQRRDSDARRQMLAQLLASPQPTQAPRPVEQHNEVQAGPMPVETSPWTIVTAGINGFMDAMKRQKQQQPGGLGSPGGAFTPENTGGWMQSPFTSDGGMKG